ncbi:DUF2244 domain-containing protein [Noviherbaspirillum sp.]|uniref:DUF2244 domain-containing protein n=1 Tax=Noviherbaspirillum sp. TaxID=1926288 RepID=UPI002B47C91B|nr:DUF2244 domain-containing protein [Noviherbaspirillum sp.]HJV83397.1 DUF2244 domain-containing protein [Noviherbaspirillum sp.]
MNRHEWQLRRNCSLSPCQLGIAFALPCLASLFIAAFFLWQGTWIVLAFTMLEIVAVALAFCQYARHATDQEHIVVADDCLLVERILAGQIKQFRLDPHWTRVSPPDQAQDLIHLEAKGIKIEVGRFVTKECRRQIALELRQELQRSPSLHGSA